MCATNKVMKNGVMYGQFSQDLADTHIFATCQPVIEALRRHDCGPALQWCETHRVRLKKAKSKLAFSLRVQEYVELVKLGKTADAIAYARTHLAPWATTYLPEMLHAFALVVMSRAPLEGYQVCVCVCHV